MAEAKKNPGSEEPPKTRRRVKKSKGHGGHHGGAWKVAYADFVTAMMALFLVLWLVSQADTKLKQSIASYFRSPGVFTSMNGGILSGAKKVSKEPSALTSKDDEQALFSVAENIQKKFSTRPEFSKYKDQVKVDVTDEGLRIQLIDKADKVSFPSGSADLSVEARAVLAEISNGICGLPNKINIGGHTDRYVFPSKTGYTNWELSTDRANAARRVLESVCVKPEQINRIVGFADTEPMVPDDPYAPANRRISITVLRMQTTAPADNQEGNKEGETAADKTGSKEESYSDETKPTAESKQKISEAKPASEVKTATPEKTKENAKPVTPETPEQKTAKAKLANEGAVIVGEPDDIPKKPKQKETEKKEP